VEPVDSPTLQLEEHLAFQQRMFVVRCVGMLLLVACVLAALAGLLGGNGPLAQGHVESGPAQVRYPRFTRYQMPTRYEFEVDTAAVGTDTFDIVFEGEHAREFTFEEFLPEPDGVTAADDRVRYTFKVEPGVRQLVVVQGQPESMGSLSGTASIAGGAPMRIDSFVYP
jgi:hypothetical protein